MIKTDTITIPKVANIEEYILNEINLHQLNTKKELLRYAIVKVNEKTYDIEVSILENENKMEIRYNIPYKQNTNFCVVNIIPTGVQAEIGGYIADATPVTNVLDSICDKVIVHPNVVNGSFLNYSDKNVLYTEGYTLDNFLQNKIALQEVLQNRIGVVIDKGAIDEDPNCINEIVNIINSHIVIVGVNCIGYTITKEPIGGHAIQQPSGAFSGEVKNPQTMIEAAGELILKGATAIAIVSHIDIDNMEKDLDKYFSGNLPNPFGGTEALISHTISRIFGIPCAHAPVLSKKEKDYYASVGVVDPRASSEVVSSSYTGCILKGLNKAPQIGGSGITLSDVKAIIVPYNSVGGIPMLMSQKWGISLICIRENKTCLNVTPELMQYKNYIIAENYLEAIGIIASLKAGITIESLRRPIKSVKELKL